MNNHPPLPLEYHVLPTTPQDRRWMDLMVDELQGWSKHRGTKHVSVITGPDDEFRALGYNGLPHGIDDGNLAFNEHPLKRQMTMCAERNALRNLVMAGGSPSGCTLHADAVPCAACARAIVASGIGTVVMVDAHVHSTSHGDTFWKDGLSILLEGGVDIRQHDPDIARYKAATVKHYHPAIPSNTVDWDSRFLSLSRYAADWAPAGVGEVLAYRPQAPGEVYDKIVRSLGCWSPKGERTLPDALETAALAGVSTERCTLYLSRPERLATAKERTRLIESGISGVVLPDEHANDPVLLAALPPLARAGIKLHLHHAVPQDYSALVECLQSDAGQPRPPRKPRHGIQ